MTSLCPQWLCCSLLTLKCLCGSFSPHMMFGKLHSDLSSWYNPLLSKDKEGAALRIHYLPYCAPFPRLNQSLQGDWLLSWLASELQVEEEEVCRVQVEAVLLGLRKKDVSLGVDFFWGSSDCCCNLSCWLMTIWMSSLRNMGKKREWEVLYEEQGLSLVSHIWQEQHVDTTIIS